jgi:sulfoacetaldehyde dehydrogenase
MSIIIDELIGRARAAQKAIEFWPQEKVDEMVLAVGWENYKTENAQEIARLAVVETGMGLYEHKVLKHQNKTLGVLRDLKGVKTVGIIEADEKKGLIKIAKPVGVIGALTPVTNCEATLPVKGLYALKTRNAIIFAPHPKAKKTAKLVCEKMWQGLNKVGAPKDLIQTIEEPTIELSQELMGKVDLVVATGGGPMVKSAYSSGTPAYGVGAGNAVVIVDETADLEAAAEKIYKGKSFDNATSCSSENSIAIQESVYDVMMSELKKQGGYFCNESEREKLKNAMWPDGVHLNKDVVAQPVEKIASLAGINIPEGTKFLMAEGKDVSRENPFCKEKLSLVLAVWKYNQFEEAIELIESITSINGQGHSCGIHTTREDRIIELGTRVKVSRIMVNQSQSLGNSGNFNNGMPITLTLGCGTWGGNITSENVNWKHYMNITWISKPIEINRPSDEEIFGDFWNKYGK